MRLWIPALLLLSGAWRGSAAEPSDSLRSALDAVARRQRHLAGGDEGLLRAYRYLGATNNYVPEGVGQPEDIGYGFQKSGINSGGIFNLPSHLTEPMEPDRNIDNFDRVMLGTVENVELGYPKNSPFRELEKKSFFREQQDNEDHDPRHLSDSVVRKLNHHQAEQIVDPDENGEYLRFLQSMWGKYRQKNQVIEDGDDMTEEEVARILKYVRQHGSSRLEEDDSMKPTASDHFARQNNHGIVNEFLNGPRDIKGWSGNRHYRKRFEENDGDNGETQRNIFNYWKYGPPTFSREYIGVFGGERDSDSPDGRGEDDAGLSSKYKALGREQWLPLEKEEGFPQYSPQSDRPMKRMNRNRELTNSPYAFLQPAYGYSTNRKRFPVTKRSPRLYASPPLLHHEKRMGVDIYDAYKKYSDHENATTTDPKVVKELNQIFSADENPKNVQNYETTYEDVLETKKVDKEQKLITATTINSASNDKSKHSKESHKSNNENRTEDHSVVSQQDDGPIEIKKKSIDWSDYFGIDRRRKKLQPQHVQHVPDYAEIPYKWWKTIYEKMIANLGFEGKENSKTLNQYSYPLKRNQLFTQPFDTRKFETGDFASDLHKTSFSKKSEKNDEDSTEPLKIDKMDKKIKYIEDLILNQAVKYTGAHEDAADSKEIQNIKSNVMSQLAAAYSLEKIRKALSEFKSILAAQKDLKSYPENDINMDLEEEKNNLMVMKKGNVAEKESDKTEKNLKVDEENIENSVIQLLDQPLSLSQLSEGYMGGRNSEPTAWGVTGTV
ncbi:uncharacterized protein LOC134528786 isoform X2 [Bacillus rossius redtenbacheri]|uniref:uncharacterized protein LOC134528786 isoform X2 n=1 Tax=Bacillus rossius redtenbacheri TaxID=93214 RepID=UPI002FDEB99A